MTEQNQEEQWLVADEEVRKNLPPGIKLVRTLRGHTEHIGRFAWSPDGKFIISPSADHSIRFWNASTGKLIRTTTAHDQGVSSIHFAPDGSMFASGSDDRIIKLWRTFDGQLINTFVGHQHNVESVAISPNGQIIASGSGDTTVKLWDLKTGKLLQTFILNFAVQCVAYSPDGRILAICNNIGGVEIWDVDTGLPLRAMKSDKNCVNSIAFDIHGKILASGGDDGAVRLWDVTTGRLLMSLEGHTSPVKSMAYSYDGKFLVSKSFDGTVRIWLSENGLCVATFSEPAGSSFWPSIQVHPKRLLLAVVGSDPGTPEFDPDVDDALGGKKSLRERLIHIFQLDRSKLYSYTAKPSVRYTSAKIVVVGDSGVGKTGLGWRLAHGEFKEHSSTHGQQFWLVKQLCKQRHDGTLCEAVLWDLAGQPDYRLIHALFLDDADLALVLFDPTRNDDPLSGVEFWLKQLKVGTSTSKKTPTLLVAARSDRGTPRLTQDELKVFCEKSGVVAYLPTSAKVGEGIEDLSERMQGLIQWDDKPATVTTETFKRIKDFVLEFKENPRRRKVILMPDELRERLEVSRRGWRFSNDEMFTAVGHLANHGFVTRLKTSLGEPRILLTPELLNNLAASFVLEARRNVKGLGSLEEKKLLTGEYKFTELEKLNESEQAVLLDSAAVLFLEHNVCFRETDPHNARTYLVFPELINLKRPADDDLKQVEDGVAYTVNGAVENVYASLVVLMGYTQTFTRTNQWRNHARYEVGNGQVCGFRLEEERAGELDFVLYFGIDTDAPVQTLFQSLFENFLARRNLTVRRFEPVFCINHHPLNRAVVRQRMSANADFAFCSECGDKIKLPKADKPIHLTKHQVEAVEADRRSADRRSLFEQVLFRLKSYMADKKVTAPECFISYAWGNHNQERWVEKSLATDIQKAGVSVVLDRWENARIGSSLTRFVERVAKCDLVIVVGTPLYKAKYDNIDPIRSFVVAAEGDLIGNRMVGSEAQKDSVLPILLEGTKESAFPHLLQTRVFGDFRNNEDYFNAALGLLLSLYRIPPQDSVAMDLREFLEGRAKA